jgi:hypothetical protein
MSVIVTGHAVRRFRQRVSPCYCVSDLSIKKVIGQEAFKCMGNLKNGRFPLGDAVAVLKDGSVVTVLA